MICAVCGCSDFDACVDAVTGERCSWIAVELCSSCLYAPLAVRYPLPYEREPLYVGFVLAA